MVLENNKMEMNNNGLGRRSLVLAEKVEINEGADALISPTKLFNHCAPYSKNMRKGAACFRNFGQCPLKKSLTSKDLSHRIRFFLRRQNLQSFRVE
jgi:hypothetical protein